MTIATETSILKHAMGYAARQLDAADLSDPAPARAVELADARCQTLESMRVLHAQAVGREQEAARQEAIRAENERVARELAAERERIAAELAAIRREADALAAAKAESARLEALAVENRERLAREDAAHLASLRAAESDRLERLAYERLAYERGAAAVAALSDEPVVLTYGNEVQKFAAYVLQAIAHTNTEGQAPQQVLKAEGESPDATDRETPATASPHVGATGAGQAADAAPAEEPTPAPPTALQTLAAEARSSRFPSRPKMGEDWWDRFYALADEAAA